MNDVEIIREPAVSGVISPAANSTSSEAEPSPTPPAAAAPPARPKPQVFAGLALREKLRVLAMDYTQRLSRSVARQTSYDIQPCVEYKDEVQAEYELIEKLLYIQNCRAALERCLESGAARLHFKWQDEQNSTTKFRKLGQGRVEIYGFQLPLS